MTHEMQGRRDDASNSDIELKDHEGFRPFDFHIKDTAGTFDITETADGSVNIEVGSHNGKRFSLNTLLPDGYKVTGGITRRRECEKESKKFGVKVYPGDIVSGADTRPEQKEISLSQSEAREYGFRFLALILHEIGHAIYAEHHPEENRELIRCRTQSNNSLYTDITAYKKYATLVSKTERWAWAFAIRQLKQLEEAIGLPRTIVFPSHKDLRAFIEKHLRTYQSNALAMTRFISSEKNNQVTKEIIQLYLRKE